VTTPSFDEWLAARTWRYKLARNVAIAAFALVLFGLLRLIP